MRRWMVLALGLLGAAAVVRQWREGREVRQGQLPALGPYGDATSREGPVHAALSSWMPTRPRTASGRLAAASWSAPLSLLGLAAATLGGRRTRWDPELGAWVAFGVGGPFGWFLQAQGATAATLGQVVVVREDEVSDRLLVHEAAHARQQERLGLLFALLYPTAGAVWGYRRNPFEVAARSVSARSASA